MLILTDAAKRQLSISLDNAGAESDIAVRLVSREAGWLPRLHREAPDDETFDFEGRTVLLLSPEVAEALADGTPDVDESDRGAVLRLTGPP
jgi:hypothetical protein